MGRLRILDSGIREIFLVESGILRFGIRISLTIGIRNPVAGIRNPWSLGFPYMGRHGDSVILC